MNPLKSFHYQILGESHEKKLVFLHGLMGSGANWRRITPSFQDDYQILLLDQRGHGRTKFTGKDFAPEDYADDLNNILNELQWDKVNLVGHSMGGRNALVFADNFPHRINKLVIEDIGPDKNEKAAEKTRNLIELVPTPFSSKSQARQFFLNEFEGKIPNNPQARVLGQYFYTNIEEKEDGSADWRFSKQGVLQSLSQGRLKDRWTEIKNLKVPTLVIRGENSQEFSEETYRKVLESNPLIQGVEISDSGHWVHFDQPQEFIKALQKFFQKPSDEKEAGH